MTPVQKEAVKGLSTAPVDALRYSSGDTSPYETPGLLLSLIPEGARVLDIGCGMGSITRIIRDYRRADVLGIEPNFERAKRAEEEGIPVVQGIYTPDIPKQHGT